MATLTLRPESDSDVELSPSSGTDNFAMVDEVTHDSDTTHLATTPIEASGYDLYGFPNHTTETGTINSVKVYAVAKEIGSYTITLRVKMGGTTYDGDTGAQAITDTYASYSDTWTTNPNSGVTWTWTDIDNLIAGLYLANAGGDYGRCTQLYVVVDYTFVPRMAMII